MSDSAAPVGPSLHLSVVIDRPWRRVYEYVSDPRNLPRWAAGLAGSEVQREVSQWSMNSPMGRVLVSFVPENVHGVMATVTLPSGESVLNAAKMALTTPLQACSRCAGDDDRGGVRRDAAAAPRTWN